MTDKITPMGFGELGALKRRAQEGEPYWAATADEVLRAYAAGHRNFDYADLRGQSFRAQRLTGISLNSAALSNCDFRFANLSGANLRGAFCHKAHFEGAWLTHARLRGALLKTAEVWAFQIITAHFAGAYLPRSVFAAEIALPNMSSRDDSLKGYAEYSGELLTLRAGCFEGNPLEFIEAVKARHGEESLYVDALGLILKAYDRWLPTARPDGADDAIYEAEARAFDVSM
jgi:hypothetical protein